MLSDPIPRRDIARSNHAAHGKDPSRFGSKSFQGPDRNSQLGRVGQQLTPGLVSS